MEKIEKFRDDYAFLSNFYTCNITYNGRTFKNVEAAFQAQKCIDRAEEFTDLNGVQAKHLGRKVLMRPDWNKVKLNIMEDLIRVKFQDPYLKELLLKTEDIELIEGNNWRDYFWGVCKGKGSNHLGKILMKIRNEIKNQF